MDHFKNSILLLFVVALVASSCSPHKKLSSRSKISVKGSENATVSKNKSEQVKTKYSALLNVEETQIENIPLYLLIDDWYGTRYKYGGCDKNGVDCSNFVSILYQQVYNTPLKGSSASIFNQCKTINRTELREGDLLFFKIDNNTISHIGMYLQNNKFVHSTTKKGVMIDDLDEPYYTKYYYKSGRLK